MTSDTRLSVAVFGLGEAGSLIAGDLAAAGVRVRAFDPAPVPTPNGVSRVTVPGDAIPEIGLVISVTAASDSRTALEQAWEHVRPTVVYADMATASPGLKRELAEVAAASQVPFADVALMAPVPGRGMLTPALASGTGAAGFAGMINPLGGHVDVVGVEAGQAAARKLMRSIVTKGLTALLIETLELGAACDEEEWLWGHLVDELTAIDETALGRLLDGTARHAARRVAEMEAVRELADEMGVAHPMTTGTITALRRVVENGVTST